MSRVPNLILWRICHELDWLLMVIYQKAYPVLWSFRRCPYAMRARLAIKVSRYRVWLREIMLREKPTAFIAASQKATVPVLVFPDGTLIDESRDIMIWSLQVSDPEGWLRVWKNDRAYCNEFFDRLDGSFKTHLDQYKYASRFNAEVGKQSRQLGALFLAEINRKLARCSGVLYDADFGLLDAAALPFVRQFRGVDSDWFDRQDWPALHHWLNKFLESENFTAVMQTYPPWQNAGSEFLFPA